MAGIPGSFGGALFMNAGSRDSWIGSRVAHVTAYEPGRGLHIIYGDEIDWEYRSSNLSAEKIIVEATLLLKVANKGRIAETMQGLLDASRFPPIAAEASSRTLPASPPPASYAHAGFRALRVATRTSRPCIRTSS